MAKITQIKLIFEDGTSEVLEKFDTRWLLAATRLDGFNRLSLSGDDRDNCFLMKMLDMAVVKTITDTQRIGRPSYNESVSTS